ncbi:hypothetical protein B7R54_01470 [Subtercola boreus]|uniref:Uncharacterized protein n=1 Tax=Subtercola boreus TaxID=120213 RepID=A0A3E0VEQ7_9MICO|nr:hypothetical protein [Subtercola boreus]RFA08033.1 hypothetical protein B7R54_01470 [Subtercola boreus]TQL55096.1 hypothetical protein FB464_2652 [Subtercola boreus]
MTLFEFDSPGDEFEPPPRSRASALLRRIALIVVVTVIVGVPVGAVAWSFVHQRVEDQVEVWQYRPSPAITAMADESGMGDEGRFYFYASAPTVESAADFLSVCGSSTDDFVLLGCYTGSSIHVFDVPDARLSGIRGVTAAHEMLHAVYARLSDSDRSDLDRLLEQQYDAHKGDPELAARMLSYAETEPGQRDNELHSIFGTEVAALSPELETHYAKYFTDRTKVVALNASFEAVFSQIHEQESALAAQVTAAGDAIDRNSSQYSADSDTLSADVAEFNIRAAAGDISSRAEFDRQREALEARQTDLANRYAGIQSDIAAYDALRDQLQALNAQAEELGRSLDSTLQVPATPTQPPTPAPVAGG